MDLDVFSGFFHGELGYTLSSIPLNLAITYDYASGDEDVNDNRSGVFDAYFGPIKGDLGPTGQFTLVHRNNLSALGLRLKYQTQSQWQFLFHWQAISLDSATDSFGRLGVRDITGNAGRFAGHRLHAGLKIPLPVANLHAQIGAVYFSNGRFFDDALNATGNGDPRFVFSMLEYSF